MRKSKPQAPNGPVRDLSVDQPDKQNKVVNWFKGRVRRVEHFSLHLLEHPWRALFVIIVLTIVEMVFAGVNWPSKLYLWFNPIANKHVSDMIAKIVDSAAFIGLPLATLLIVSSLLVQGLIANQRARDSTLAGKHDALSSLLKRRIGAFALKAERRFADHVKAASTAIDAGTAESVANLGKHIDTMIPTWSQVVQDEGVRNDFQRLTGLIERSPFSRDPARKIVLRSLLKGMIDRLSVLMDSIGNVGSFMDPEERRKLTTELFQGTKSYHILMVGLNSPISGVWGWHPEYLKFLREASKKYPTNVSWTFIEWTPSDASARSHAIADVKSLGLDCYIFARANRGDVTEALFSNFLSQGPFIEIFGSAFGTPAEGVAASQSSLMWKATSLRLRQGHRVHKEFDAEKDSDRIGSEGIWSTDEIAKLIRIGVTDGQAGFGALVLEQIAQWRVRV